MSLKYIGYFKRKGYYFEKFHSNGLNTTIRNNYSETTKSQGTLVFKGEAEITFREDDMTLIPTLCVKLTNTFNIRILNNLETTEEIFEGKRNVIGGKIGNKMLRGYFKLLVFGYFSVLKHYNTEEEFKEDNKTIIKHFIKVGE